MLFRSVGTIYKSTNNVRIALDYAASASDLFTVKDKNDTFTKADGEAGTVADMTKDSYVKVTPIVVAGKAADTYFHNIVVAESKLEDVKANKKTSKDVFTIEGKDYSTNANLFTSETAKSDIVGTVGTFTLDVNNKIVAFNASKEDTNEYLGYITYAQVLSGRNDGKVTFDIVIDGKTLSYTTSDKISTDGSVAKAIRTALLASDNDVVNDEDVFPINGKYVAAIKLDKDDNVTGIRFVA